MAVSSKVEELILELTKNVGNIYDALKYGIGDNDTPGSSIFELNNLETLASTGYPYFGIIESNPLGFGITYDLTNDPYYVTLSSGQVAYNGSVLQLVSQKIPIKREWTSDYSQTAVGSSGYKYGITIGFPISEAQKSTQSWSTVVGSQSSINTNVLFLKDVEIAKDLGFPLQALVGNYLIKFSGVNTSNTGLVLDPSYYNGSNFGVLPTTFYTDTAVNFIFQPRAKYILGFPVEEATEVLSTFDYFPPLPKSWIPIGKVMVKNPENPVVANSGTGFTRTVVDMPSDISSTKILGDSADRSLIVTNCSETKKSLLQYKNNEYVRNIVNGISSFANAQKQPSASDRQFWSLQPFRATEFYSKGLSFSGLERFEFPYNFAESFYNTTNSDVQHTFAIFRGDLITYNSAVGSSNQIAATGLTSNVIASSNYISSLSTGTQVYGATVVYNIAANEYTESIPTYTNVISSNFTNSNYLVELIWTGAGVTNPLFYNVYKKPYLGSEIQEKKLTQINEIQFTPYNTLISVTDSTDLTLNNGLTAFKITPQENCFVGGVTLKFKYNAGTQSSGNGTTGLFVSIFSGSGSTPTPNGMITSNQLLRYSDITSGTNSYTVKFDTGANLGSTSTYWIVIDKPSNFTTALGATSLYTRVAAGSGQGLTSLDSAASWSSTGGSAYYVLRGYLDDGNIPGDTIRRGLKFTGRVSFTPRRLSVYVPPVDDLSVNTGVVFNGSTTGIATTTDKTIKNDLIVTVIAKLGENGEEKTLSTTVPKGTGRDERFLLGSNIDLFDRIVDVYITPGTNLTRNNNGPVLWDIYDLITIETVP
jgi:hypothetical protein